MSTVEKHFRCAIYTRKSSEEGLEQSFNSLDAQREACESFVNSQRHEGWRVLPSHYDDGGYSGGTMDRPGLKRLLEDVQSEKIDVIVVYKVDRLTRSLLDFAKIVESLDAKGTSFVSVTQQFNTTTSMGRLTLNILLSFAQFEREVTGERIRDKIAASKRKGMWMGGNVPLGYDAKDRNLVVNAREAKVVRNLFSLYVELGCVPKLKAQLDHDGIKSKARKSANGRRFGGALLSRGALYKILSNPIYIGQIRHKGQCHPGQHKAIVDRELWNRVQTQLRSDNQGRRNGVRTGVPSLLAGLLEDDQGKRFTPAHAVKNGKRYRYYVCRLPSGGGGQGQSLRVPAGEIESSVVSALQSFFLQSKAIMNQVGEEDDSAETTQKLISSAQVHARQLSGHPVTVQTSIRQTMHRVILYRDKIRLLFRKHALRDLLMENDSKPSNLVGDDAPGALIPFEFAASLKRSGREIRLVLSDATGDVAISRHSTALLKAAARSYVWLQQIIRGEVSGPVSIAKKTGLDDRYVRHIFRHAFLAPDIVEAIVEGRQPHDLTIEKLKCDLPMNWAEQRQLLGFPAVPLRAP